MRVGECDGEIEGEGRYVGPQKAREGGGESFRQAGPGRSLVPSV